MERDCSSCIYGAVLAEGSIIYKFKTAMKKGNHIRYAKGEVGCRMNQWDDRETECLSNNFSKFEGVKK